MSDERRITDIGTLLGRICRERNWQQQLGRHSVFQFWEEVVGKEAASQAQPYAIKGDVLWVRVASSVWMQQLQLQKTSLLETINGRLPEGRIADIRLKLAADIVHEEKKAKAASPLLRSIDPEKMLAFDAQTEGLPEDLRQAMRRIWLACPEEE